jgi:hypothetical protein
MLLGRIANRLLDLPRFGSPSSGTLMNMLMW